LQEARPSSPDVLSRGVVKSGGDESLAAREQHVQRLASAADRHLEGLRDFYTSRRQWSVFLIVCIAISLVFQISITVLVGLNLLNYTEYKWFLPIVVSENFIQILGLAAIVLKWIFSGDIPKMDIPRAPLED
jgi:hypothetical protein